MSGKNNSNKILFVSLGVILLAAIFVISSRFSSDTSFFSPFSFIRPDAELSVLVVGDIMLDRNVRNKIDKDGFDAFFAGVKDLISDADLAVGNLEGPFTTYPSVTASLVNKDLTFTFDPKLAPKLAALGFDIFGLANNHTQNFGAEGLAMTREFIRNAGMFYYGDPDNTVETSIITAKNSISIGFVGFHEFGYKNFDYILSEIDSLRKQTDVLIVSPHWGVEYQKEPTEKMQNWAHQFIDHGADAVIGAHPHVVGNIEEYKGKKIFYSLGNFVFDQYFSEETMNGMAVLIEVEKDNDGKVSLDYKEIPIRSDKKGTSISTSTQLIHR
jgi:poly-gamma-glutamate synthesis protein (capsule biosynthesis protein)